MLHFLASILHKVGATIGIAFITVGGALGAQQSTPIEVTPSASTTTQVVATSTPEPQVGTQQTPKNTDVTTTQTQTIAPPPVSSTQVSDSPSAHFISQSATLNICQTSDTYDETGNYVISLTLTAGNQDIYISPTLGVSPFNGFNYITIGPSDVFPSNISGRITIQNAQAIDAGGLTLWDIAAGTSATATIAITVKNTLSGQTAFGLSGINYTVNPASTDYKTLNASGVKTDMLTYTNTPGSVPKCPR